MGTIQTIVKDEYLCVTKPDSAIANASAVHGTDAHVPNMSCIQSTLAGYVLYSWQAQQETPGKPGVMLLPLEIRDCHELIHSDRQTHLGRLQEIHWSVFYPA